MRLNTLELLIVVALGVLALAISQGCATAPPLPLPGTSPVECVDECQVKLSLQTNTVKKFERLCIAFSYLQSRFPRDAKLAKNTQEGIAICKYIYGIN